MQEAFFPSRELVLGRWEASAAAPQSEHAAMAVGSSCWHPIIGHLSVVVDDVAALALGLVEYPIPTVA